MSTTHHDAASAGGLGSPADAASPSWVPVTGSARDEDGERPVNTRRMILRVIAGAVLVLFLVAVSGAFAARRLAEKESVNDAAKTANVVAEAVVQPALTDGLLTGDPESLQTLDTAVRSYVLGVTSVRVKIWTPQGRIVYSDEASLIGRRFPLVEEQREVFAEPATRAEISDLSRAENGLEKGQGKLLEVYRPVWTPNGSPLLFETYAPYDEVTSRSEQLWRGFAGITLSSLVALLVMLAPVLWRLLDIVRRSRVQRENLLQRAVDASTDERRRIAGTLHDGVVQELAATSFVVSSAAERAQVAGEPALAEDLRGAAGTVRTTIGGLRSLLVDIYPPNLASAGLVAALEDLAATVRLREIDVHLDLDIEQLCGLDEHTERLLYRVAQECLLNTMRHARARHAWIEVTKEDGLVVLTVGDDGIGFDPDEALHHPTTGHFGVRVLADVAADSGAELEVASAPGRGTSWRLRVEER